MTRIALLQMTAGIEPDENADSISDAIEQAASGRAAMLFTPEMSGLLDRDRARAAGQPAASNSPCAASASVMRTAEAAKAGVSAERGDDEFRRLFASWQSLDNGILPSAKPVTARRSAVSIPSLAPVAMAHLSSGYGMRVHPVLGGRRGHKGIDLAAPTGTPIRASAGCRANIPPSLGRSMRSAASSSKVEHSTTATSTPAWWAMVRNSVTAGRSLEAELTTQ